MRFREADQMLKDDGWYVSDISGSHYQYKHPTKPGKVSVPNHPGDIPKCGGRYAHGGGCLRSVSVYRPA